jgi:hypothetical protein
MLVINSYQVTDIFIRFFIYEMSDGHVVFCTVMDDIGSVCTVLMYHGAEKVGSSGNISDLCLVQIVDVTLIIQIQVLCGFPVPPGEC